MATTNQTLFFNTYEQHLRKAVALHPERYYYGPSFIPTVMDATKTALLTGTHLYEGEALEATCLELGVLCNKKRIMAYLTGDDANV